MRKTPDQLDADCMCDGPMCQSCWDDMREESEAEARRLRGEVRRLRRLLRGFLNDMSKHRDVDVEAWRVAFKSALAPRRTK